MATQTEKKGFRVAVGAEPADKPIRPMRTDLKIQPQLFYGQLCFVIKDPVTLRYFRVQPVEHFLLTQLDGQRTARDLHGLLQQQFPDVGLDVGEVLRFVGMMHESHLLAGEGAANSEWLAAQRKTGRRRKVGQALSNFICIKIPVFNPEKLLNWLDERFGHLIFRPATMAAAVGLVVLAGLYLLGSLEKLHDMPYSLLSWQNLGMLYCVFVVTKVFHEFGHGWVTKHNGGEVSQMGVMLMALTPSFYCDTSDAWMIPSRKARLWINAGGIAVELVLAALATFVWILTPYGVVNQVALNVMISCSVATLFFNANPLMRYDGYYFLADLLEIPNLMTKGGQFIKYYMQKHLLGLKPVMPPDAKRVRFMITYAIASGIYRWMVVFGIIMLIFHFFDKYGLGPIGFFLAVLYVVASVVFPLGKAIAFLWKQRWDLAKRVAWISSASVAGVTVLLVGAALPWNMTIREPMVVLSEDHPIRVQSPGYVSTVAHENGDHVAAGDLILGLTDPAITNQLQQAEAKFAQANLELKTALSQNKPGDMQAAQSKVNAYQQQIDLYNSQLKDLELRAPVDGILVSEHPLKHINGNYVSQGEQLCRVINDHQLNAAISLPERQIADVHEEMPVRIRLWADPSVLIEGKVARVDPLVDDTMMDKRNGSDMGGDVEVTASKDKKTQGDVKSLERRGTVIIQSIGSHRLYLADGMTGRAEIMVKRTTVLGRLYRLLLDSTTPDWHL